MKDLLNALKLVTKVNKGLFSFLIFLAFMSAVFGATITQIQKLFFDQIDFQLKNINNPIDFNNFFFIIGILLAIYLFETLVNITNNYSTQKWWVSTRNKLVKITFTHLETLPLTFFEENSTGKIKERVDRGIMDMINIIQGIVLEILPQIFFITIALFFLYRINLIFGLLLTIAIPVYVGVSLYYGKRIKTLQKEIRTLEERASGKVTETILNIKTVKSFAREDFQKKNYSNILSQSLKTTKEQAMTRLKMGFIRANVSDVLSIFILSLGSYWAMKGEITIGTLILAWSYTNRSIQPLWHITRRIDNIQADLVSVNRVFDLLETTPTVLDSPDATTLKKTKGEIEFKDISFQYLKKPVLENVSLTINQGNVVALVGKSGVGKTTLIKLLLRFYDPAKGNIKIDNIDIKNITQKSLRENIGVVLQDSALFNETVIENIKFGNLKATKADIINAAKMANAHDFIMKLPKGYNTVVGEKGVKLSGGEQQRINIARVILKNPPILVLDEATSSLDSESEKLIQDALWKLIKGKTTIIIAHRLSTVMRADLIVVLDKGKIVEKNTHNNLVNNGGLYSKLFKIQSGGYLSEDIQLTN